MFEIIEENGVISVKRSGALVIAMGPVDLRRLRAAIDKYERTQRAAAKLSWEAEDN